MDDAILLAIVEADEDGRVARVRSPGIGWWTAHPRAGALVDAHGSIGMLTRLHRSHALVLPPGVSGVVGDRIPTDRRVAVEYLEVLFEIAPIERAASASVAAAAAPAQGAATGRLAIVSPTDGTFYRRPAADAPPFVEVGTRVRAGTPLGLVEVMKTFNQIHYGGAGLPEEAVIEEIRCADAEDVRAGQALFVVRAG